jgi:ABC-type Mn2+/Zn2+ transport system ATPase subunit
MNGSSLIFDNVTFFYDSASEALFRNISFRAGPGWTGIVGANGTGKTTLLKLAARLLEPTEGGIRGPSDSVYCSQRTDNVPDRLNELIADETKSEPNPRAS